MVKITTDASAPWVVVRVAVVALLVLPQNSVKSGDARVDVLVEGAVRVTNIVTIIACLAVIFTACILIIDPGVPHKSKPKKKKGKKK
jgi:hypothetical protein